MPGCRKNQRAGTNREAGQNRNTRNAVLPSGRGGTCRASAAPRKGTLIAVWLSNSASVAVLPALGTLRAQIMTMKLFSKTLAPGIVLAVGQPRLTRPLRIVLVNEVSRAPQTVIRAA